MNPGSACTNEHLNEGENCTGIHYHPLTFHEGDWVDRSKLARVDPDQDKNLSQCPHIGVEEILRLATLMSRKEDRSK